MKVKENKYCTYYQNYVHVIEDCYSKKKYGEERTYFHKKGREKKSSGKNKNMME